jgi:hypothetical protein
MWLRCKVFSRLAAAILETTISAYHCLAIYLQSNNKLKQLSRTLHSISPPDAGKHCQERLSLEPVRVVRMLPVTHTCRDRRRLGAVRRMAGAGRNTGNRNVAGSQVGSRMLNPGEPLGWLPTSGLGSVETHDLGRMDTV